MSDWNKADDYRGFAIQISGRNFEFFISGPDFSGQRHAKSFAEAKAAIDAHYTEIGKAQIKEVKMGVTVLDPEGNPVTLIGLHRGTGRARTTSNERREFSGYAYPSVSWVRAALQERATLQARISAINEQLHPLGVSIGSHYNVQIPAESYARKIEHLKAELAAREKLAQLGPGAKVEEEADA